MIMKRKTGFTLLETIVALGITAIVLGFFLTVFMNASVGISKSEYSLEAQNLAKTLEAEFQIVRDAEVELYHAKDSTGASIEDVHGDKSPYPFMKAFEWVLKDASAGDTLVAFKCRVDGTQNMQDGYLPALPATQSITANVDNQNIRMQPMVVDIDDILSGTQTYKAHYEQIDGAAYVIELTQLVYEDIGGVNTLVSLGADSIPPDPDDIVTDKIRASKTDTAATELTSDEVDQFLEGELLLQVDFYHLKANSYSFLESFSSDSALRERTLGSPIYSTKIGVLR